VTLAARPGTDRDADAASGLTFQVEPPTLPGRSNGTVTAARQLAARARQLPGERAATVRADRDTHVAVPHPAQPQSRSLTHPNVESRRDSLAARNSRPGVDVARAAGQITNCQCYLVRFSSSFFTLLFPYSAVRDGTTVKFAEQKN
jgi:hypothetical protein